MGRHQNQWVSQETGITHFIGLLVWFTTTARLDKAQHNVGPQLGIWDSFSYITITFQSQYKWWGWLTHIWLVDPSILINWTSPFPSLGVSGELFHFYSFSNRMILLLANREDPDQMPRSVASDLGLHCLPISQKRDTRLIWMDELGFYVPSTVFQSFQDDGRVNMKGSVQWSARLGSGRISPPAGFEPATPWSEVGSANRSATRTLLG